jgi:hypothetical protein
LIAPRKAGLQAGLFIACNPERRQGREARKKYLHLPEPKSGSRIVSGAGWNTNMRAFALGLIFSTAALPCVAQTILKSEPLVLAPYEVAFVQDAACPAGKVLKVTGAIRGLHRKKSCVTIGAEQASLSAATP